MSVFEIRPAVATDLPRLMALNHTCQSDYVWQLDVRRETGQMHVGFREVRLPRTVDVKYPHEAFGLADEWSRQALTLTAVSAGNPVGYACVREDASARLAWVIDLVISPEWRRKGGGSALVNGIQAWALERGGRRVILEMQSKNHPCIRLAQKLGYEFCGYNDQYYPSQDVALFFGRLIK